MKKDKKNILSVLAGEKPDHTPIWLMRQAGRYLPEYRALREHAGSFMKLVLHPEHAAEVTLQPVKRFGMDGAILFSDILIVPYGLGQALEFSEGKGPQLEKLTDKIPFFDEEEFLARTAPIYETVRRVAGGMPGNTTLIGFCGAPWTVACYLLGQSADEFGEARKRARETPDFLEKLLKRLVEASAVYLEKQIEAGAEVLQIFDSHAGLVPQENYRDFVIRPTQDLVARVKKKFPKIPIIGFPRGSQKENIPAYAKETGVAAVSLDTEINLSWAQENIPAILQGNLDSALMPGDEKPMLDAAEKILRAMKKPFLFNLGHGLTPQAKPENVGALVKFVQEFRA
jgi:uroporphyrinogen decarboxylase